MRGHSASRRGFTLIELVTAMGAMSVLMLAMGSVMMVARAGIPGDDDPAMSAMATHAAVERMARDLSMADAFSRSGESWTLGMPDRDGDGSRESVVYTWDDSGAGATYALTRNENGSGDEVLLRRAKSVTVTTRMLASSGMAVTVEVIGGDAAGTRAVAAVSMWNSQGY
jgi:prepilin-type N-terminal cleavage/methylation domain-containing protein